MSWLGIVTTIFPPNHTDPKQDSWQKAISVNFLAVGVVTMVNTILIWGFAPFLFSGFATVASVNATSDTVAQVQRTIEGQSQQMTRDKNELKILLLQNQLSQIFDAWCGAVRGGRQLEADGWERQYRAAEIQYNAASPVPYPMRRC